MWVAASARHKQPWCVESTRGAEGEYSVRVRRLTPLSAVHSSSVRRCSLLGSQSTILPIMSSGSLPETPENIRNIDLQPPDLPGNQVSVVSHVYQVLRVTPLTSLHKGMQSGSVCLPYCYAKARFVCNREKWFLAALQVAMGTS
jgi:hypothetical protein